MTDQMPHYTDERAFVDTDPRPRCDHICLSDDGHVERGEPHFYGYEIPSPRQSDDRVRIETLSWKLTAECVGRDNETLRAAVLEALDSIDPLTYPYLTSHLRAALGNDGDR